MRKGRLMSVCGGDGGHDGNRKTKMDTIKQALQGYFSYMIHHRVHGPKGNVVPFSAR